MGVWGSGYRDGRYLTYVLVHKPGTLGTMFRRPNASVQKCTGVTIKGIDGFGRFEALESIDEMILRTDAEDSGREDEISRAIYRRNPYLGTGNVTWKLEDVNHCACKKKKFVMMHQRFICSGQARADSLARFS